MSRLLVGGATLLGLTSPRDIRPAADLYAEGGTIVAVGEDATRQAAVSGEPVERLDARGMWIIPGFVQAHLHLCQTLLRNGPEGLELLPWLEQHVWPGEAAHEPETLAVSARLGLAECLSAGVTAVLDMGTVRHSDALFRAAARSGIRYTGGNVLMDDPATTPSNLRAPASEYASEKGLPIHTHASENKSECQLVAKRSGLSNVRYLAEVGLLTSRTCVAHAIHTDESDWSELAGRRVSVAHCPSSNLRLGSGVCPVPELRRAGVVVALGSDGAACNNSLDPFREMRMAASLPGTRAIPETLAAFEVLRMMTWDGARALGLAGAEGLVIGAPADFTILDPETAWSLPVEWAEEPYGAIVYSMDRENVAATVVDGVIRYRAKDATVGGLKPRPEEIRAAVKQLKERMSA